MNPSTSFAQPYDQQYGDTYADPYIKENKKSGVNIQKIKCINENVNVNGIAITQIPQNGIIGVEVQAIEDSASSENGLFGDGITLNKNLINICVNVNVNEQVNDEDDNGPLPPPENRNDCFEERPDGPIPPGLLDDLEEYLANNDVTLGSVNERTANVESTEGLCTALVTLNNNQNPATADQIDAILNAAFPGQSNPDAIQDVIDCLLELGLIVNRD